MSTGFADTCSCSSNYRCTTVEFIFRHLTSLYTTLLITSPKATTPWELVRTTAVCILSDFLCPSYREGPVHTPELAYATMERGGVKSDGFGEQVPEEAPNLAQEGTLDLNTPKLL